MAAAWKATFRSPRRPSRALGCHNADSFRRGWRAGTVQRPRMLTAFCWKAQDQRNRRGTTGYFVRAHSALRVLRPAVKLFDQPDFLITKRLAVSFSCVLFVR